MLRFRIGLGLVAFVLTTVGCDEPVSPPAPQPAQTTAPTEAAEAPKPEPDLEPEPEPLFGDLLVERPFDESTVQPGLRKLSSCKEYEAYVKEAFVDYHLRRLFSEDYGRDFRVGPRRRIGMPERVWAVDGSAAFLEYKGGFYEAETASQTSRVIENEMYKMPGLQAAAGGFLFVGSSTWLSGPNDRGYLQFRQGDHASGWGTYNGVRKTSYRQHRNTGFDLYGPSKSGVRFIHSMRMAGELLGIHVDETSNIAYFALLTEPHVAADVAEAGRSVRAATREEAEKQLRAMKIRIPRKELPRYSWQKNPRGGRTKHFGANLGCQSYWVANDPDTTGQHVLLIHPFDLSRQRYGEPLAVTVEDDVRVAFSGERVLIARRLNGVAWVDGTMERPLTELDVFELGAKPRLIETHQLQGVPVDLVATSGGGVVVTTRGERVERLTYRIVGDAVAAEHQRHQPDELDFEVVGDVPQFVWEKELVFAHDLVFQLGKSTIAVSEDDNVATFTVMDADGAVVGTTPVENILKLETDELIISGDAFILAVRTLSGADALVGRMLSGGLELKPVTAPRGATLRAVAADKLLAMNASRAVWVDLESGEELQSAAWEELKPTSAGRP